MFKINLGEEISPNQLKSIPRSKFTTTLDTEMIKQIKLLSKVKSIPVNIMIETLFSYLQDDNFLMQFEKDAKLRQSKNLTKNTINYNGAFEKFKEDLEKGLL